MFNATLPAARISKKARDKLIKIAKKLKCSESDCIRSAIEEFIVMIDKKEGR